ncbi:hypothetical protein [Pacificoceanicola onchidii]|uniref:hypothetical protein n=1 Tax=Pacificoceanicola onchidii TaxID=2562685 RepID=UPI0010A56B3A|nr:hypothetical protein [Pacificoceanicola onchidii]
MVRVIDLPPVVPVRHAPFWLETDTTSAGAGLDGREQVVFTENRRWVSEIEIPPLRASAARLAAVVGDQLRGRANLLRITFPNFGTATFEGDEDAFLRSIGIAPEDIARGFVLFGDGSSFDDGAGFALPDHAEPTVVSGAAAGASSLELDGFLGRSLAVGSFFSINDFLYRVEQNTDGTVVFNPPLREPVSAGDAVAVTMPSVLVRLRNDAGWRVFQQFGRHSERMRLRVTEAFDR